MLSWYMVVAAQCCWKHSMYRLGPTAYLTVALDGDAALWL